MTIVMLVAFIHLSNAALCDKEYQEKECPKYCTGILKPKCCSQMGKTASILTVPSPGHALAIEGRVEWYKNCTGGSIQTPHYAVQCTGVGSKYCGGFRALFEIGRGAIADAKGIGMYDGYMTQAIDLPELAAYVEDL